MSTQSLSNMDASAAANGSSVGSAIGIGIGVGVNTAFNTTTSAIKADTVIDAQGGVTAEAGMLDILSSDYVPAALLAAALRMGEVTGDLASALARVTAAPADAVQIGDRGRLPPDIVRLIAEAEKRTAARRPDLLG